MYLVIDTWVWCKAQTGECYYSGIVLLHIAKSNNHKILLDDNCEIETEYRNNIHDTFWIKIFTKMVQKDCFLYKSKILIDIKNFDPSDLKFLQVAASIPGTPIVSGETDFLLFRNINTDYNIKTPIEILPFL